MFSKSYVQNNAFLMKKILALSVLLFFFLGLKAQEPGNNLGKSVVQIQQKFPNLTFLRQEKGYQVYKSKGDGDDFTSFYFSNGMLVGEYDYIFDYSGSGFISNLYRSLLNSFAKFGSKYKRNRNAGYDITFFYYSDFIVKIANYNTQLQIYYELNGYHINISALQARPPRY